MNKTRIPAGEIARVKALGFLVDKRTGSTFNARVLTRSGRLSAAEMRAIAEAAERFGSGEVAVTVRQTAEIQGVPFERIDELRAWLDEAGLETGGTGPRVRPVVSCKGTTCRFGLIDTCGLAAEIQERFYKGFRGVRLPHKFKIAVGSCPNNCVKPALNDLGVVGQRVPAVDPEKCRGCRKCLVEAGCPIRHASLADGRICIDPAQCIRCGRCVGRCPFHAVGASVSGFRVYIGGRSGRELVCGRPLDRLFTDPAELLSLIGRAILFFRDHGADGERFSDTIARLGFDAVQAALLDGQPSDPAEIYGK